MMLLIIQSIFFWIWRRFQALKGLNPRTLTSNDVPDVDLSGKWIIISGANSGVGFEAAKHFSRLGANLILACRNPPAWEVHPSIAAEECQSLAARSGHSSTIEWWEIEMTSLSSIESFAKRWLDTGRVLDILCNNSGMADWGPKDTFYTEDGFERVHQVNFLSHVFLTLLLLPSIARSNEPRIVCSTSVLHLLGEFDLEHANAHPKRGLKYSNNKLYFQMWLSELQSRFLENDKYKHITINGIHPGYVHSSIWKRLPDSNYPDRFGFLERLVSRTAITNQQGSLAIINAATAPEFGYSSGERNAGTSTARGGNYINRIWKEPQSPICRDEAARLALWNLVDKELKLKEKGLLDIFD